MKIIKTLIALMLSVTLIGCSSEKNVSIKLPSDLTQKVGSDEFGYYTVPTDFYQFSDIANPYSTDIQYADLNGTNIVTINIVETGGQKITLEQMGTNIKNYLASVPTFVSAEGKTKKVSNLSVYQLNCKFSGDIIMVINLFEDSEGVVHYISVEGFNDFVSEYNDPIVSTFTK